MLIPFVLTRPRKKDEQERNIFTKFLASRIIFVTGVIDDEVSRNFNAQLLFLEAEDPDADISVYINSPGGSARDGLVMYDVMKYVKCDINVLALGNVCSAATLIYLGGTKGKRFASCRSRFMFHQPSVGTERSNLSQWDNTARELKHIYEEMLNIYTAETSKDREYFIELMKGCDAFLSPQQCLEIGCVDEIIQSRKVVKQ